MEATKVAIVNVTNTVIMVILERIVLGNIFLIVFVLVSCVVSYSLQASISATLYHTLVNVNKIKSKMNKKYINM